MSEEEKKAIENLKIKAEYIGENYSFGKQGIRNLKKDLKIALNYIDKLQKELEEKTTILMAGADKVKQLEKENEELKNGIRINTEIHKRDERIKELEEINACLHESGKEYIRKEKIRKFIKEELPDDEIMECCEMFDSNGVYLRKKLEEILEE